MLIERGWRVTMADVDAAGVLYYGSAFRWAEMILGDWLEQCGHPLHSMFATNEAIPVVAAEVRYRSPLSLDDHCRLGLSARRVGRSSFTLRCAAWGPREALPAAEVTITHVFSRHVLDGPAGRVSIESRALPSWLKEALESDRDLESDDEGGGK
jgi:YbgC/YbaW family acyl-CoA thioester hydrolase